MHSPLLLLACPQHLESFASSSSVGIESINLNCKQENPRLTQYRSHAPVAALLPARVRQLPIDFRNRCNVGYAFLNIIDDEFSSANIVRLFEQFDGKQ